MTGLVVADLGGVRVHRGAVAQETLQGFRAVVYGESQEGVGRDGYSDVEQVLLEDPVEVLSGNAADLDENQAQP